MLYLINRCNLWNTLGHQGLPLTAHCKLGRVEPDAWGASGAIRTWGKAQLRLHAEYYGTALDGLTALVPPVWWWCNLNKGIRREKGFNFSQAVKLLQTVAVKYSYINLLMFPWLKLGRITFPKRNISSDKIWRQIGKGGRMSDNSWPPGRPVEFPCGPEWVTRRHLSSCIQTSLALANWSLSTPNLFVRNRVSQCICIKSIWS